MKYLIVKHWMNGTFVTENTGMVKMALGELKKRDIEEIIYLENLTRFDPEKNEWVKIEMKNE